MKEERGRGLPLSLQSLPGSSTVDSGFLTNIIVFKLVNYFCSLKKNNLLLRLPTFQNCVLLKFALILLCNIFILTVTVKKTKNNIFFGSFLAYIFVRVTLFGIIVRKANV